MDPSAPYGGRGSQKHRQLDPEEAYDPERPPNRNDQGGRPSSIRTQPYDTSLEPSDSHNQQYYRNTTSSSHASLPYQSQYGVTRQPFSSPPYYTGQTIPETLGMPSQSYHPIQPPISPTPPYIPTTSRWNHNISPISPQEPFASFTSRENHPSFEASSAAYPPEREYPPRQQPSTIQTTYGHSPSLDRSEQSLSPDASRPKAVKLHICHCGKAFSTSNDLERHGRSVHNEDGKYNQCRDGACPDRGKYFARRDNFLDHIRRMHQNGLSEEAHRQERNRLADAWVSFKKKDSWDHFGPDILPEG